MKQEPVFGAVSWEYALGCIQASSRPPLSREQWARLEAADFPQAVGLLRELGYSVGEDFLKSLEEDFRQTAAFVREISPCPSLEQLLFFEEDACNLKLYRKAAVAGMDFSSLLAAQGSMDPQLLAVCAEVNDYSLLGEELEQALSPLGETQDPCRISCVIDNAFFCRAKALARQINSFGLADLLERYGEIQNRLTAWRISRLGWEQKEHPFVFLSAPQPAEEEKELSRQEILEQADARWRQALEEASWTDSPGAFAGYFFEKKLEWKRLGRMLSEKKTGGGMTNE